MRDSYALEPGGPQRIFVFHPTMNETHVSFDRETILRFRGKDELRMGNGCLLPDGSSLEVRLVGRHLEVRHAGKLLSGESRSPEWLAKRAGIVMVVVGTLGISSIKHSLRDGIQTESEWTALGMNSLLCLPFLFSGGLVLKGFRPALLMGVVLMAIKLGLLGWSAVDQRDLFLIGALALNAVFAWLIWAGWTSFRETDAIQ